MNFAIGLAPSCPSARLIRESALGHTSWEQTLEAIAQTIHADTAQIEMLRPLQAALSCATVTSLYASPNFIRRWRNTYGDTVALAKSTSAIPAKVFEFVLVPPGDDKLLEEIQQSPDSCHGIDSEEGFFVLSVRGRPGGLGTAAAPHCIINCLDELSSAANLATAIRRAQQKLVLELLDSGGTAAMVLDNEGWVRAGNATALQLLGNVLHLPGSSSDLVMRTTATTVHDPLPLEHARLKQWPFMTPSGQKLMIYAMPWNREDTCFRSGDELLVAWDTRLDAPMLNGSATTDYETMARALQQTFSLTKSESALATRLIGADLRSAAQQCGMAYETARSHLKSIFARMKIRRQGDLVALLSRFAYHERLRQTLGAA